MKKLLNGLLVTVICGVLTLLISVAIIFKVVFYALSAFSLSYNSPLYDYDLKLPSPDARYDLVVLRGDASAIDDFSYNIYVFPRTLTPKETPRGKQF